uniref:cytochrome P450 93A3-like n=1 Tax=Erigeron canadensis TaxID=72917 RepID=UPI001CB8962A|nr:cytochrome P450 93A3-like [Erigeron canadensis]
MADFQGYLVIFLLGLISIVIVKLLIKSKPAKSHLPPTPFALPIIGHLHLLGPKPHHVFHNLSVQYGPVFRLFLGSVPCVIFSSSESAKELFKTSDSAFLDRPRNSCMDYISYGGNSMIFAPYGSYWKFLKKIVMSELLNARTLDSLLPVRSYELDRFITFLSHKAKDAKPVELQAELMTMTNNVISRMLTGKMCTSEGDDEGVIRRIVTDIGEVMGTFNLSDHIWFFQNLDVQGVKKRSKEIRARFDSLIEKIINEHEEVRNEIKRKGEVKDLLDILLDISENECMEIKLTREHIKAFVLDIMGGGTHSSAISTEWALAELINHPNIMKKAIEEIDQVVGKNRLLQESDIPNLPYLQAIVKESLRLHPAAPVIQRQSIVDCSVGGYQIPAKTTIFFNVWSLGRDPNYWESPLEFRPERFEEKQMDVRGQNFQLLPFGSGRRMCPGSSLALMVIHVTLGSMIQCFEWKAGKDGNLTSVDMEEGTGITLPRANPLVCIPTARIDPLPLCM